MEVVSKIVCGEMFLYTILFHGTKYDSFTTKYCTIINYDYSLFGITVCIKLVYNCATEGLVQLEDIAKISVLTVQ